MSIETIKSFFDHHQLIGQTLLICGVLSLSFISYFITKHFIIKALSSYIKKTKTRFDDILLQKSILRQLSLIAPLVIIFSFSHVFPLAGDLIKRITVALISWLVLITVGSLLTALNELYLTLEISKNRPIKGYIQVAKLILYLAGAIFIISTLLGRSPLIVLSSFGALTAVLLVIFRDTILSFVASLQITSNDLIRVGDWVEIPKYGADGDVIDFALHTVTIQNFDKTLTILPTHKLIEESFKNWRGMKQSGGRRIKRSINIDMESIKFCDDRMIDKFKKIHLIADYTKIKEEEIANFNKEAGIDTSVMVNRRRMTNIGTFRAYVKAYLENNKKIHKNMTFLVRQLPPGSNGLPLEIYVFTNDTVWAKYEEIQSDIFDHILAVIPEFELHVFQNPTGRNFERLSSS
ncbi:MAG: mechanosensitive ion channel family protein [Deltaproteobacteria bacterium]|nr:mechanosensitive ion channel family protein [Deltaproteobacteria bacterium]